MTHPLYRLMALLDRERLYYRIDRYRPDTVTVIVSIVGERLEIEVFDDEHIEFSRFRGSEMVEDDCGRLEEIVREAGRDSKAA